MLIINGQKYEYGFFPDGTPLMRYSADVREDAGTVAYKITWLWENLTEQVILQNLVWHIQEKQPDAKITLNMPYVPNARMDRTQNPDEVFTLRNFARFINELNFFRVFVLDPHSSVAAALLNNAVADNDKFKALVGIAIDKCRPDLLFYPDNGCQKRLEGLIKYPHVVGWKDRDWNTGKIIGTEILGKNDVENKTILIIDDICSYGGTFLHSAKRLKELGAGDIYLYVTHCENSVLKGELINSGLLEKIYTTRTVFTGENSLIEIIGE